MKRRDTVMLSLAGAGAACLRLPAWGQARTVKRIGYLSALPAEHPIRVQAEREFADGMKRLGWEVGRDLLVDVREGRADSERHFANARELVASGVDLIIATDNQQTAAALRATRSVPILMATVAPVEAGFAKSLARPGGNVTGVATVSLKSQTKPLALLREIRPNLARLGVPINSHDMATHPFWSLMQAVGRQLGIAIVPLPDIQDLAAVDNTLAAARQAGVQAMTVPVRLFLAGAGGRRIRSWAIERRVLTWSGTWLRGDVLLGHSASVTTIRATLRRQIDRVLRGANPAETPIEEPTQYDVVIDRGMARAMGLGIPYTVLLQATEVMD